MKVLLAGPGTGKTTKIGNLLSEVENPNGVLILSFTNATVNDLIDDLKESGVSEENCMTLHKFAVKYNHDSNRHVLHPLEIDKMNYISQGTEIDFKQLCDSLNCTTFDQMIERFVSYAKANPVYLEEKISNFHTLIIDEYQDFNPTEQNLIDELVKIIENVIILGDDDQCIYDFKDASTERIIDLHKNNESLPHEHICYRCPDIVVEKGSKLISRNKKRVEKDWHKNGKDGSLVYKQYGTPKEGATYIVKEIKKILATKTDEKILILSPVRFAAQKVAEQLEEAGIDFSNLFSKGHPDSKVIKSWELRYLFGKHKYLNLMLTGYFSLKRRKEYYDLIKDHIENGLNKEELFNFLEPKLRDSIKTTYDNIDQALETEAYIELRDLYDQVEGRTVEEKLENLFRATTEIDDKQVKLMTIHMSKGLGAPHVFMLGLTEGIIPNQRQGTDSIESQRRLFYVGMTRTKRNLHLITTIRLESKHVYTVNKDDFRFNPGYQLWEGRASRFIEEMDLS